MTTTVKLRKIGNSLGVILPKEVTDELRLSEGDTLRVVTDPDGARLTSFDPEFAAAMKAFERTRGKYRKALRDRNSRLHRPWTRRRSSNRAQRREYVPRPAAGELTEDELAAWTEAHSARGQARQGDAQAAGASPQPTAASHIPPPRSPLSPRPRDQ
jgi:putative addiction module antidote